MIRLDLKREPHWLDLGHGVRLHVRPCTTALMMAARAEVQRIHAPSRTNAGGRRADGDAGEGAGTARRSTTGKASAMPMVNRRR